MCTKIWTAIADERTWLDSRENERKESASCEIEASTSSLPRVCIRPITQTPEGTCVRARSSREPANEIKACFRKEKSPSSLFPLSHFVHLAFHIPTTRDGTYNRE